MTIIYSTKIIIESNADLNPYHQYLTETLLPSMRSYSRKCAIEAAIRSLQDLLNMENSTDD